MAKFIAYVNQTNNGCDYTIACGKTLWEIEAETLLDAKNELRYKIFEDGGFVGEGEIGQITLYSVVDEIDVSLVRWYEDYYNEIRERDSNEEKMEYLRLKEKYG